jgi:magnesium-transporting ATPase (P-type)
MGLIKFFVDAYNHKEVQDYKNLLTLENTLTTITFSSSRKRASIVIRNPEYEGTDKEVRVYCKGAPDMLFDLCNNILVPN